MSGSNDQVAQLLSWPYLGGRLEGAYLAIVLLEGRPLRLGVRAIFFRDGSEKVLTLCIGFLLLGRSFHFGIMISMVIQFEIGPLPTPSSSRAPSSPQLLKVPLLPRPSFVRAATDLTQFPNSPMINCPGSFPLALVAPLFWPQR